MEESFIRTLAPHVEKIYYCIKHGFEKALPIIKSSSTLYSATTKAAITRDFILSEVRNAFHHSNIIEKKDGLVVLRIEGALIKFKKFNKKLQAGNIPTKQATNYMCQGKLPGITSSLVHLHAGYVLDESGFGLQSINLTCPETSAKNSWILNLEAFVQNNLSVPLPPVVEAVSDRNITKVKLTPKASAINRKKKISNEA